MDRTHSSYPDPPPSANRAKYPDSEMNLTLLTDDDSMQMDMSTPQSSNPQLSSTQRRPSAQIQIPIQLARKFLIKTVSNFKSASQLNGYLINKALAYEDIHYSTLKHLQGSLFIQVNATQSAINLSRLRNIGKHQLTTEAPPKFNMIKESSLVRRLYTPTVTRSSSPF